LRSWNGPHRDKPSQGIILLTTFLMVIVVVLGRDEVQKHSLCDVSTLLDNDIK
jgi:hypothetical protein